MEGWPGRAEVSRLIGALSPEDAERLRQVGFPAEQLRRLMRNGSGPAVVESVLACYTSVTGREPGDRDWAAVAGAQDLLRPPTTGRAAPSAAAGASGAGRRLRLRADPDAAPRRLPLPQPAAGAGWPWAVGWLLAVAFTVGIFCLAVLVGSLAALLACVPLAICLLALGIAAALSAPRHAAATLGPLAALLGIAALVVTVVSAKPVYLHYFGESGRADTVYASLADRSSSVFACEAPLAGGGRASLDTCPAGTDRTGAISDGPYDFVFDPHVTADAALGGRAGQSAAAGFGATGAVLVLGLGVSVFGMRSGRRSGAS